MARRSECAVSKSDHKAPLLSQRESEQGVVGREREEAKSVIMKSRQREREREQGNQEGSAKNSP